MSTEELQKKLYEEIKKNGTPENYSEILEAIYALSMSCYTDGINTGRSICEPKKQSKL